MSTLKELKQKNQNLDIFSIEDAEFLKFGRVIEGAKPENIIAYAKQLIGTVPDDVKYEASVPKLEEFNDFKQCIIQDIYGGMPVQIGWCYGHNSKLNGLEFHQSSEVIVAVTDIVLLLGIKDDLNVGQQITYDADKVMTFYCKAGSVVELYAPTLHYAPVNVFEKEGFIALIVLQKGTNSPTMFESNNDGINMLLSAVNTWSIMHPESLTGYVGIKGDNIQVKAV